MSEIDVSKCKHYKSNGKCKIPHYQQGIKFTSCNCSEWDCYYKQLQKSQNTIIVGLQIQTMLLANNSKLNKCLDEIEEIVKEYSPLIVATPLYKIDNVLQKIKEVKDNE